jgi:hypothetical protein
MEFFIVTALAVIWITVAVVRGSKIRRLEKELEATTWRSNFWKDDADRLSDHLNAMVELTNARREKLVAVCYQNNELRRQLAELTTSKNVGENLQAVKFEVPVMKRSHKKGGKK